MSTIQQIILYKHGMGYFERKETVQNNGTIKLEFKKSDMNDLLKSLSVYDGNGGVISSISYDTSLPEDQEINDIGLKFPYRKSLSELLAGMRGALISFRVNDRKVKGEIVGVEEFDSIKKSGVVQNRLIVWNGEELNNYNLLEVEDIKILDEKTRNDFQQLLNAVFYRRNKKLNELTIYTKGEGEREIFLGYTLQSPVWKTSYRISISDGGQSLIQGWAMIDNTGQEDWKDVKLSLVSGLPISFKHDLHSPRYRKRPELEIRDRAEYDVPLAESTVESYNLREEELAAQQHLMREATLRAPDDGENRQPLMQEEIDAMLQSADESGSFGSMDILRSDMSRERGFSLASNLATSVGIGRHSMDPIDYYIYEIDHPVTVDHGQSALVPILAGEIEARKVAFFDMSIRSENPMTAILMKNNTGMVLEEGPVTVYGREEYLGEGMMNTLIGGDETILPFAVELGCRIESNRKSERKEIFRCKIENGYFHSSRRIVNTTVYEINNTRNEKTLDLFLDHPVTSDFELSEENHPYSRSRNNYRFRMEISAGEKKEFSVEERGETTNTFSLLDLSEDKLENYMSLNVVNATIGEEIVRLLGIRNELKEKKEQIELLGKTREEIFKNQERIRENIRVLGDGSEDRSLRARYLKKLNEDEEVLARFREDLENMEKEKKELQQRRNNQMKSIYYQAEFE